MIKEIWRPVVGWEEFYEVSSTGRVRSVDRYIVVANGPSKTIASRKIRGQEMKFKINRYGYAVVHLARVGAKKYPTVHRLVAFAFLPSPQFADAQVNHKNYDRLDNRVENLEWTTVQGNSDHKMLRPCGHRGEGNVNAKLCPQEVRQIRDFRKSGRSLVEIGKMFSVSNVLVGLICRRKIWKHVE